MKIKDLPRVDRPREKLLKYGSKKLSNAELIAIILGKGKKGENAVELAKKILKKIPINKLLDLKLNDFNNLSGIGKVKALQVIAAIELGKRIITKTTAVEILKPQDIWNELKEYRSKTKEYFIAFYLDVRNEVISKEIISVGTLYASLVHPREVFEPAIRSLAAQIILSHNHPSGDPSPSEDDLKLTRQLIEAGKLLGIEVIDHVIITKDRFISLKEKGII